MRGRMCALPQTATCQLQIVSLKEERADYNGVFARNAKHRRHIIATVSPTAPCADDTLEVKKDKPRAAVAKCASSPPLPSRHSVAFDILPPATLVHPCTSSHAFSRSGPPAHVHRSALRYASRDARVDVHPPIVRITQS
jgi:hypothetical protein